MKDRTWWLIVAGFSVFSFVAGWMGAGFSAQYRELLANVDHGPQGSDAAPMAVGRGQAVDGGTRSAPGAP
jgi:hypothetical protein